MTAIDQTMYLREMRKRIRKVYRPRPANRISPGEELHRIAARHRKAARGIPSDIQLWLALFDEVVAFWLVVWGFYRERIERRGGSSDKLSICLMTVSGRIFQDMICIRDLIERGFFVQSNVVARSLIESIDVMHLLDSRHELADEFMRIERNEDASKFWHEYCSRDKIGKLVKTRWLWFFNGDEELAGPFHGLRYEFRDLTGMSAHPSFGASFAAFMDSPQGCQSRGIAYNAMGAVSHMSKFTMHLIFLRVFEYGILWCGPKLSLYRPKGRRANTKYYEMLSKGLSMVFSIVSSVDTGTKGDPFYPEFNTYWPVPWRT